MAVLNQNQFEFDEQTVLNTVLMGHKKMWSVMHERDAIYSKEDFTAVSYTHLDVYKRQVKNHFLFGINP